MSRKSIRRKPQPAWLDGVEFDLIVLGLRVESFTPTTVVLLHTLQGWRQCITRAELYGWINGYSQGIKAGRDTENARIVEKLSDFLTPPEEPS